MIGRNHWGGQIDPAHTKVKIGAKFDHTAIRAKLCRKPAGYRDIHPGQINKRIRYAGQV